MQFRDNNPALLLIDIQKAFLEDDFWGGNRNNRNAEVICGTILNKWRELKLPIFHIRHSSQNVNSKLHCTNKGFEFNENVIPLANEPIITKYVNSAFIGTDLKEQLGNLNIDNLVIVGLTTNHCVSTTARMAGNLAFNTVLISDAIATFDRIGINGERFSSETIHQTSLASLNEEFCSVWSSEHLFSVI